MPTIRDYIMGKGNTPLPFGLDKSDPMTALHKIMEGLNSTLGSTNNNVKDLNRNIQKLLGFFKDPRKSKKDSLGKELIPFKNIERQIKDIHQNFGIVVSNVKEISKNTKLTSQNLSGILNTITNLSKESKKNSNKEDDRYQESKKWIQEQRDESARTLLESRELRTARKDVKFLEDQKRDEEKELEKLKADKSRGFRQSAYSMSLSALGLGPLAQLSDKIMDWEKSRQERDTPIKEKGDKIARLEKEIEQSKKDLVAAQERLKQKEAVFYGGAKPSARSGFSEDAQYVYSGIKGLPEGKAQGNILSFIAPKIGVIESNTTKILRIMQGQGDEEEKDRNKTEHYMDRQLKVLEDIDASLESSSNVEVVAKTEDKKEKKGLISTVLDAAKSIFGEGGIFAAGFGMSLIKTLGPLALLGGEIALVGSYIKELIGVTKGLGDARKIEEDANKQSADQAVEFQKRIDALEKIPEAQRTADQKRDLLAAKKGLKISTTETNTGNENTSEMKDLSKTLLQINEEGLGLGNTLSLLKDSIKVLPEVLLGKDIGQHLNGLLGGGATAAAVAGGGYGLMKAPGKIWGGIKSFFGGNGGKESMEALQERMFNASGGQYGQQAAKKPGMLSSIKDMGKGAIDWMSSKGGAAKDFIKGGIDDLLGKAPDKFTKMFKDVSGKAMSTLTGFAGKAKGLLGGIAGKVSGAISGLGLKALGKEIVKFIPFLNAGIVTNEIMTRLGSGDYLGAAVAATGYGGLLATAAGMGINAILDMGKVKREIDAEKAAKDEKLNDSEKDAKVRDRLEELKKANPLKNMVEIKQMMIQEGTISGELSGRSKLARIKEIQEKGKTFAEAKAIVEAESSGQKIEARAKGGPVKANTAYLVGEDGPELFTSPVFGNIIPNDLLPSGADVGRTNAAIKNHKKWDWIKKGGENHPGYIASKRIPPLSQQVIDDFYVTGYTPGKGDIKMQGSGKATSIGDTPKTVEGFGAGMYKYVTAAVDPRVLPYGTVFALDQLPGVPLVAADTGSAIQGTHIDVAFEDMSNARKLTTNSGVVQKIGKIDLSKVSHKNMRGKLESMSFQGMDHALLSSKVGGDSGFSNLGGVSASAGTSFSGNVPTPTGGAPTSLPGSVASANMSPSSTTSIPETAGMEGTAIKSATVGIGDAVSPLPAGYNTVVSPFGPRKNIPAGASKDHKAIDLRAPIGTPVFAVMSGTVSGFSPNWGGVTLSHENGTGTKYLHLSKIAVKGNQKVNKGDIIGYSGDTRDRKAMPQMAPHLHFAVFKGSSPINPLPFLQSSAGFTPTFANADVEKRANAAGMSSGVSSSAGILANAATPVAPSPLGAPSMQDKASVPTGPTETATSAAVGMTEYLSKLATGGAAPETLMKAAEDIKGKIDSNEFAQTLGLFGANFAGDIKKMANPGALSYTSDAEMRTLAHPEMGMTGAEIAVAKAKTEAHVAKTPAATPPQPIQPPAQTATVIPSSSSGGGSSSGGAKASSSSDPNVQDMYLSFLNTMNDMVA